MTAITVFPKHFYGQLENVSIPNPQLATSIDDGDLEINLNTPITYSDGTTVVTIPFTLVIRNATTNYPETLHVQAGELSVDGTKITLAGLNQRGIDPSQDASGDVDYLSGIAGRRADHPQGSEVRISIHALDFKSMSKALLGEIASGSPTWQIGREIDEDITIYANNGDANLPFWKYDSATSAFVYSNDGVSSTPFGTGAGVTGGDGIDVTLGVISVDTADTNTFVKTSSGAADENKVIVLDAAGKAAADFIPEGVGPITGEIRMWSTASAPTGWLIANADAVSRTTYAALFAVVGTAYGVGDGSTTFNLPDFRGRTPIGAGTGDATDATAHALADKEGTETHTLITAEMPAHTHTYGFTANAVGAGTAPGTSSAFTEGNTGSAGSGAAHNNLQPSLTINFIIKI